MAEMLKIDNIKKTFNPGTINEKVALNGVNLSLEEGDFVTVIGGNGAGKSTTLNAIAGVWPVDSGKIYIGGDDVTRLSEYKRAKYLGRVFQDQIEIGGCHESGSLFILQLEALSDKEERNHELKRTQFLKTDGLHTGRDSLPD